MRDVPDHFRLLYSQEAIAQRVAALAAELYPWVKASRETSGQQVLAVCVLRGGVFFFADLLKAIPETVEPSFCRCASYDSAINQATADFRMLVEPGEVRGRNVLLIDDICDSGRTLARLQAYAVGRGAVSVKTAVLIHRQWEESVFTPDHLGFEYAGKEWLVGYGMEDRNHRANYPDVYVLAQPQMDLRS